jgi:hypothetical protein
MSEVVFGLVATLLLGAAVVFAGLSCGNRDGDSDKVAEGDDEEYDVCEENGHDYRDHVPGEFETTFVKKETGYPIERGVHKAALPGSFVGLIIFTQNEVAPCRDCSEEDSRGRIIEMSVAFRNNGDVKTVPWNQYKSMEKEYLKQQR